MRRAGRRPLSALSFAPDGRRVAVATQLSAGAPYRHALDVVTLDGRLEQRLVDDLHAYPSETAWAPDGLRIALASGDGGVAVFDRPWTGFGAVLAADTVTGAVRKIAHGRGPVLSPDGSLVTGRESGCLRVGIRI